MLTTISGKEKVGEGSIIMTMMEGGELAGLGGWTTLECRRCCVQTKHPASLLR